MQILSLQLLEQLFVEARPNAAANRVVCDVAARFDRRLVAGLGSGSTAGWVADDRSVGTADHEPVQAGGVVVREPLAPVLQRHRFDVHAEEVEVDIEMETDLAKAGCTDRIDDTIDYRAARAIAKETIEGDSVELLETLAARIADRVLALRRVAAVSVRVAKRPASMMP